jgi:mRNA interferase HicA
MYDIMSRERGWTPADTGGTSVKAGEFVRKIRRLARERGLEFSFESRKGKGSHGRLLYGTRLTTVKDLTKEIGPGLQADMLKQLGLTKDDLL